MTAIFFDMDGVLIDSEPVWQEAVDTVFGRLGIVLDEATKARTAGMSNAESVVHVLTQHPQVQANVAAVCREIDTLVLHCIADGIGAIPGADGLVRDLDGLGVPLALVSTSGPALMQAVIRAHGLDGRFRVVLSSEEVGPGKPDPAVYLEAVRRMRADAGSSLAIEDTLNGVRAAHGAGLAVIGFTRDLALAAAMRPLAWQVAANHAAVRRLIVERTGLPL